MPFKLTVSATPVRSQPAFFLPANLKLLACFSATRISPTNVQTYFIWDKGSSTRPLRVKRKRYAHISLPFLSKRVKISAEAPYKNPNKPMVDNSFKKPLLNKILASRRMAVSFIGIAGVLYIVSICLIAKSISSFTLLGYQRVLLLGLGILLPDFRHVLKSYSDAVRDLQSYKPAFQGFRFNTKLAKEPLSVKVDEQEILERPIKQGWQLKPELTWLSDRFVQMQDQFQEKLDDSAVKFDALLSTLSRDVAKPIVETSTQIQQFTTGTDLTLRKNVIVAATSVFLSLAGYMASTAGEVSIGGVAIMLASLLPSALLSPRRHEMLTLVHDSRVVISLVGTLSCVISVFFPMAAAYCFLICCVALVSTRFPAEWMRNL